MGQHATLRLPPAGATESIETPNPGGMLQANAGAADIPFAGIA